VSFPHTFGSALLSAWFFKSFHRVSQERPRTGSGSVFNTSHPAGAQGWYVRLIRSFPSEDAPDHSVLSARVRNI